jgi:flagella synthesis protein FlgN
MSSPANAPASSLLSEQESTRALIAVLMQEQTILIAGSVDGLPELTATKSTLLLELTALAIARHARLAESGFPANEQGMRAWCAANYPNGKESPWSVLLSLTAEAKELNRVNGMLIARHMVRNQTELNILQGKSQQGGFYGPDGQSTGKSPGRGLAIG